jgi:putative endonuclease
MYTTYVLYSASADRLYVGQTGNLSRRYQRHADGLVRSTAPYRPWRLIHFEQFFTRREAMQRERQLKSHAGRRSLRRVMLSGRVRQPPD